MKKISEKKRIDMKRILAWGMVIVMLLGTISGFVMQIAFAGMSA